MLGGERVVMGGVGGMLGGEKVVLGGEKREGRGLGLEGIMRYCEERREGRESRKEEKRK